MWMYTSYLYINTIQYSPLPRECTHPIYTSTWYNALHFHVNVHILSIHQHDTILSTSTWMYTSYLYINTIQCSRLPRECTHHIYTSPCYNTLHFHMNVHILSIHHHVTILSTSTWMYTSYLYITMLQYFPLPHERTHAIYTSYSLRAQRARVANPTNERLWSFRFSNMPHLLQKDCRSLFYSYLITYRVQFA